MASSGYTHVRGNPTDYTTYQTYDDLQERKKVALGSTSCSVSSSEAPHALILKVLEFMDRTANICDAEANKVGGGVDAGRVAYVLRDWHTKLWNVLVDLNIAEEQRARDVFKAVDWYNDNLAQHRGLIEQSNMARIALEQKYKQDLVVFHDECARRVLACEAENTKLRGEIQRLRGGGSVSEENDQDAQDDNLFAEMVVDKIDE